MKREFLEFNGNVTTWKTIANNTGYSVGYCKRRYRGHYQSLATLRGQGKPNALVNTNAWLRIVPSMVQILANRDTVRFNVRNIGVFGVYVNPVSGVRHIRLIVLEFNGKILQQEADFYPIEIVLERA